MADQKAATFAVHNGIAKLKKKAAQAPSRSVDVYNPFKQNHSQQPFLSPLGEHRRALPTVAAPLAVTIIGGVALVIAFGALFSGMARKTSATAAPSIEQQAVAQDEGVPEAASTLAAPVAQQNAMASQVDVPDQTAAIPPAIVDRDPEPQALSFNVPVADNEDDIAVLEVIQMPQVEDRPEPASVAAADETGETVVAQAQAQPGLKPAVANGAVNLRASPDNNARVLTVVPAKAQIEAEEDCNWCAVSYQGSQGFIYKSFIDYR